MFVSLPIPKISRATPPAKESKYNAIFSKLEADSGICHLETDFVDAKKMVNRIHGAVAAYRARTGDASAFTVRVVEHNGAEAVAVWKLAKDFTPRKPKSKAE